MTLLLYEIKILVQFILKGGIVLTLRCHFSPVVYQQSKILIIFYKNYCEYFVSILQDLYNISNVSIIFIKLYHP